MTHQLRCRLLEHQGRSKFLSAKRATAWPNPYEASLCQETNCSSARIVLTCCRGIGPGAVDRGSCADMLAVSGANRAWRHHTRLEVPASSWGRRQSTVAVLRCDLESMLCPPTVLFIRRAADRVLASACQAQGRGSPRTPGAPARRICRRLLGSQRGGPLNPDGAGSQAEGHPWAFQDAVKPDGEHA